MDGKDKTKEGGDARKNKVRLTLSCKNVKSIERGLNNDLKCQFASTISRKAADINKILGMVWGEADTVGLIGIFQIFASLLENLPNKMYDKKTAEMDIP